MNAVWDNGDGHRFTSNQSRVGGAANALWDLFAEVRRAPRDPLKVEWRLWWEREGRLGTERKDYVPMPPQVERTVDSTEDARDACVAFVQGEALRGRITL